jgi:mannose-6-phosphate isomerase-like protein (cupin superfamily)
MWKIGLLFTVTIIIFPVFDYAQAPGKPHHLILAEHEGDTVGDHYIKADPQTGSMRLGVGLQKSRRGISMHMHESEDEVLFIHSGFGMGIVGNERKSISAGTTLYIPQGTWHAVELQSDEIEILWIASPPHFAEHLREIGAKSSEGGKISSKELNAMGHKHGYIDSGDFFNPRIAKIAATLALIAVFVALLNRVHPFRATTFYALGGTVGTIFTLVTIGVGYLPPLFFVLCPLLIVAVVFIGALGGIGIRWLASRLTSRSS